MSTYFRAGAIRDAAGTVARPGVIIVDDCRIVAAGTPQAVGAPGDAHVVDRSRSLLVPSMVNAHAHLDLSTVAPVPYSGSFLDWVGMIMRERPTDHDAIAGAVEVGIESSRRAGVAAIGDIAASATAVRARLAAHMPGTSYLECVGTDADAVRTLWAELGQRVQLQPHAPFSAGPELYGLATTGRPSTHLAETEAELEFVRDATGPFAELLRELGKWRDTIRPHGVSPVRWLEPYLRRAPWLLAHCNYVDDDDIALLAETGASVAYCPVASAYFGHRDHRYRDMLAAGVNVCLGTDSIVCQPVKEPEPLGILPQVRYLWQRDGFDGGALLHMATLAGARALHLDADDEPSFRPGNRPEWIELEFDLDDPRDPWEQALSRAP